MLKVDVFIAKINCIIVESLLYSCLASVLVPGSSAVEQEIVNLLVGGSNPSRGAKPLFPSV